MVVCCGMKTYTTNMKSGLERKFRSTVQAFDKLGGGNLVGALKTAD